MTDIILAGALLIAAVLAAAVVLVTVLDLSRETLEMDPLVGIMTPLNGPDYTWAGPTHECLCGCSLFHVLAAFDQGEVSYYVLEGICYSCGGKVTLPCPLDVTAGGE
jgi:glycerol uptake facilitator-like aquaporin